jgi:transcriptional regulator with XRE-family HTH domain/very-short-patch-repair endonuclease
MILLPYPFKERLRSLRKAAGLTLRHLALLSGLDFRQIQKYEAGERRPELDDVRKLAEALKGEVEDLVDGTDWMCAMDRLAWKQATRNAEKAFGERNFVPPQRVPTSVRLRAARELNPQAFGRLDAIISRRPDLPAVRAFLRAAPFDSGPEGLAVMNLLACECWPISGRPQRLGFRKLRVICKTERDIVGDCPFPALWLRLKGVDCVVFPHLTLQANQISYDVDFLLGVCGKIKTHWLILEVDGAGHRAADDPKRDADLKLPVIRFVENELTDLIGLLVQRVTQRLAENPWCNLSPDRVRGS